jgi:glucan exporter ATP-binding protein
MPKQGTFALPGRCTAAFPIEHEARSVPLTQIYLNSLRPLGRHKIHLTMIVLTNLLLAGGAVLEPILFGNIIDSMSRRGHELTPLLLWLSFAVVSTGFSVLTARWADRLAHKCQAEILAVSFENMVAMPIAWHNRRGSSNVFQTLVRACESLFNIWLEFMRSHLATFVALMLLIPTALATNLLLGLILIALGLAYWWIGKTVMARTKDGQRAVERHYHNVFMHMSDTINNVTVLHAFNRVEVEANILRGYIGALLDAQFPVLDWWAIASVFNRMAATISMTAILITGLGLVRSGELSVGDIVTFIGFATMMIARLDQVRAFAAQTFEASSKLEEFIGLQYEAEAARRADHSPAIHRVRGRVEFRDVSFHYDDGTWAARNLSFVIEPGQKVAIVGPTGAGKTTIVNLLQRIYDPVAGLILIDDVDIATVSRASIRDHVAVVMQDTGLLNRSISQNIRLGREDASPDEVRVAAAAAAAHDFICRRPEGYDAAVGNGGGRLSGGERQRIAIARAILKAAPILVLDEATSALDVETETLVKEALDHMTYDRTTFIIAHRLSTVRDADLVLVLNAGRIVECGSYQALQRSSGQFSRLLEASGIAA